MLKSEIYYIHKGRKKQFTLVNKCIMSSMLTSKDVKVICRKQKKTRKNARKKQ